MNEEAGAVKIRQQIVWLLSELNDQMFLFIGSMPGSLGSS